MTKSKNLVLITIFLCFSFLLTGLCFVGCDKKQLATPQIVYENGTIKWQPVKNAEKYEVKINDQVFITYNCIYDIPLTYNSKDYNVSVKSIGKNINDSDFCKPLIFTARRLTQTPVTVEINSVNTIYISFDKLSGISKYVVKINNKIKGSYSSSYIHVVSSDFQTGENIISVEPDIEKEFYDVIIPAVITVEKSESLPNIRNYKLIDGQIYYGYNYEYIYDTSHLYNGRTNTFTLCNFEENKIPSDGPIVKIYKCYPYRPAAHEYSDKYQLWDRKINDTYNFVKIELFSETEEIIFTKLIEFSGTNDYYSFYIYKNTLNSTPYYIKTTTWGENSLRSNSGLELFKAEN